MPSALLVALAHASATSGTGSWEYLRHGYGVAGPCHPRGCSSSGRTPASQAGGGRFKSGQPLRPPVSNGLLLEATTPLWSNDYDGSFVKSRSRFDSGLGLRTGEIGHNLPNIPAAVHTAPGCTGAPGPLAQTVRAPA